LRIAWKFLKQEIKIPVLPVRIKRLVKLCIGCLILIGLVFAVDKIRDSYHDKSTAYIMAKEFVSKRLVAPFSVKFPLKSEDGIEVKYLGGDRYIVSGYLDSKNTFGHEQRSGYQCIVRYAGSGEWTCEKIIFE
jgi:hypothetical protein